MSDLIPKKATAIDRKRQKKTQEPIEFKAPSSAADPNSALEEQVQTIEESKFILGQNVAASLSAASKRGFSDGLRHGLNEGAIEEATFFSECVIAAGRSLL
jgi:hypothetical protein